MSSEERFKEERRLQFKSGLASRNMPDAKIRGVDVRARLQNFGGIRQSEGVQNLRLVQANPSPGSAPDSVESLPFFERSVLNEFATSAPFVKRQANFLVQSFNIGVTPFLIREREKRLYFLIQSTAAINSIFLGFDFVPSAGNGILLIAGAVFEPIQVPTNDIWVVGAGANTTGVIIYATE